MLRLDACRIPAHRHSGLQELHDGSFCIEHVRCEGALRLLRRRLVQRRAWRAEHLDVPLQPDALIGRRFGAGRAAWCARRFRSNAAANLALSAIGFVSCEHLACVLSTDEDFFKSAMD